MIQQIFDNAYAAPRLLWCLIAMTFWLSFAAAASPTPWSDSATGMAIGGYDPVAYFTLSTPSRGRGEHEAKWHGSIWRFVNSGNRDAFVRDPDVYAPQFSGYDAYAIASGRSTRGHPSIWAIRDKKLYLFHSSVNRRLWLLDAANTTARAKQSWPMLSQTLPGYIESSN